MKRPAILITGAAGEVGHSLIEHFTNENKLRVIGLDINPIHTPENAPKDFLKLSGDITDKDFISNVFTKYEIHKVFHLAAVLSSGGEKNPERTHKVNVEGSFNLITAAKSHGEKIGRSVTFMFPSTMAVYGISSLKQKQKAGSITEDKFLFPITMYGVNKLYVEHLGRYYSSHYKQLDDNQDDIRLDFRAVRFPGLMSAETLPAGGTSDYASEMIHAAAQNISYACFVSKESKIPFMAMPDAIRALIELSNAPRDKLTQSAYNVTAFSVSADDIHKKLLSYFPELDVTYLPNIKRENIVNTWPEDIDDSAANRDWGWKAKYDFSECFGSYLIPNIQKKYQKWVG